MTPPTSLYLKQEITGKDLGLDKPGALSNRWMFVGIDMAPIENLETGVAVLDRDRNLLKMEKLNTDEDLLLFLKNLGPAENMIIALDIPKSLNVQGKWRQQQVKMHPLRLGGTHEAVPTDRYAQRAKDFVDAAAKQGYLVLSFFTGHAKLRLGLSIPFRNRTPAGCRALQALIKQRLGVKGMSSNLAPSSVLDAMVGAYVSWLLYKGQEGQDYRLYQDAEKRPYLDPLQTVTVLKVRKPPRRSWRR